MRNSSFPRFDDSPLAFEDLPSAANLELASHANKELWESDKPLTPSHEVAGNWKKKPSRDQATLIKDCPSNEGTSRR